MEIYLIRHTAPKIEKGVCYGQSDIDLADTFSDEVAEVLKKLPNEFDALYASPLKRCAQLAMLIKQDLVIDDRLMELDFGSWELQKWNDINQNEIQPWFDDFVNCKTLNGESYIELYERAIAFYSELINKDYDKVAIVTHSGVIRCILAHINKIELKDSFDDIKIGYGGVFKLEF